MPLVHPIKQHFNIYLLMIAFAVECFLNHEKKEPPPEVGSQANQKEVLNNQTIQLLKYSLK